MATTRPKAQVIELKADRDDLKTLYTAFKKMDKDVSDELKKEVYKLSDYVAKEIRQAAASAPMPRQAQAVAATTKARRDRIPTIAIGGTQLAKTSAKGRKRPHAGDLLFGSEFGTIYGKRATLGRRYRDKRGNWRNISAKGTPGRFKQGGHKFPPRSPQEGQGNAGYWIFPTLKRLQPRITRDYHEAVYRFLTKTWGK